MCKQNAFVVVAFCDYICLMLVYVVTDVNLAK